MEDPLLRDFSDAQQALDSALPSSRCSWKHIGKPFHNGIDIACYFGVPESQYEKSIGAQESTAALILVFSLGVLRCINFDKQFRFEASEVGKEGADRILPAELESLQLPSAQSRPQLLFGLRWRPLAAFALYRVGVSARKPFKRTGQNRSATDNRAANGPPP